MHLWDTNILVDWFARRGSFEEVRAIFMEEGERATISWICAAEFLVKATKSEAAHLNEILLSGELKIVDEFNFSLLEVVAEARRETGLPLPDSIILATAKQQGLTLITRDGELSRRGRGFHRRIKHIK